MSYLIKNRRTMVDAIQADSLGEEAREFIAAGSTRTESPSMPASAPDRPAGADGEADTGNPPACSQNPNTMTIKAHPHFSVVIPAIVSMTFRLPAPLSAQLVGAATERKLRREEPFTQQDIVAEALRQWFDRNGYGPLER